MMQRQFIIKIVAIFVLIIFLLIPINMVKSLVYERMSLRNEVVTEIANSYSRSQQIKGPMLIVPYTKNNYDTNTKKYYQTKGQLYFLPEKLDTTSDLTVETRNRGIYEARVYNSDNKITGSFEIPSNFGITEGVENYQFEPPSLAIGISDTRGIGNQSSIIFDNKTLEIEPGTGVTKIGSGIHAKLNFNSSSKKSDSFPFDIQFNLKGTSHLSLVPIGKETTLTVSSNWPHPSFVGNFLPVKRTITNEGFTATWQTNFFASDIESKLQNCFNGSCYDLENTHFKVSLVEPVDHYSKTDRAIKYGILFIGLTFFGFFIFEVIRKLAIHPIQYSFVGMSLAIFFLLLLSLSEYIGFVLAYLFSAIACISIISFYITGILENKKQAFIFTATLILIYLMLYILLNAEAYSLVMGSILVFIILCVAMIATRRLDWYKVTTQNSLIRHTKTAKEPHHE